jgi:hypothetical protein
METNNFVFSEMKKTLFEEQTHMIKSLDSLKSRVHTLFGEK